MRPLAAFVDLPRGEEPLTLVPVDHRRPGLALGTAQGVVKRVDPDYPQAATTGRSSGCATATRSSGAVELRDGDEDLVFVTTDAQLLHFPAASVRPQGRAAGGMAGVKLAAGAAGRLLRRGRPRAPTNVVVTSPGRPPPCPAPSPGSLKVTPYAEYPAKGRATGGVRCSPLPAKARTS